MLGMINNENEHYILACSIQTTRSNIGEKKSVERDIGARVCMYVSY